MDYILRILFFSWPFLHIIAAIAIVVKAFFIFSNKGFDVPGFVFSFFRIYSRNELVIHVKKRRVHYMMINNFINYYLYTWLFITTTLFLISGKSGF